jgi:prepilin-type N-terminal cleavage/methylation domain-containing protein/prepilin-type processing-associated H-X9-DG protein
MNYLRSTSTRRQGFTLIELLVVITIVVVLTALAFVASSKIRNRAKEANAMNSLRQIGIGHVSYASENHGAVNTIGASDDEGGDFNSSFWGRMQPYLFSGLEGGGSEAELKQLEFAISALFQTSDARTMTGTPFSGIPTFLEAGLPVPLGFNEVLEPTGGQQARMTIYNNPSRIIYASYGREFFNSSHGATYTPMPQGTSSGPGIYYLETGNALICFLDGHVETMTPPIPQRMFGEAETD